MAPTYQPGNVVFGWNLRKPRVGDVVVARQQNRDVIKRVQMTNPSGGYFLVGDNPSASTDSRVHGWVDSKAVQGVVMGRVR